MKLFPGRRDLPDSYAGVRGEQVSADSSRHGVVDDGNIAWPERVTQARRSWMQARAEDFERVGKRLYIDKATGLELVAVRGAPLLSVGQEETRGINCFLRLGREAHLPAPTRLRGTAARGHRLRAGPAGVTGDPRPRRAEDPMKTRRVTENGISWVEVVPWAPPDVDQPIRPLASGPPEVALSLDGNPGRSEAERHRLADRADRALAAWGIPPRKRT